MLQVSKEFHAAMVADNRRTFGRIVIDFTDPLFDQSIAVAANEQINASGFATQVADNVITPPRRWASADGSTLADGNSSPAPDTPADGQMGWWGTQMAETGGAFSAPFPTVTVNFASRPVHSLRVVGDSMRGEFPVDFEIRLLGTGGIVRLARTVTGNVLIDWQEAIVPVTEVTQYVLEVRRWSHAGRQAKVLEMFTSVQETYEGDNLISIELLEERELAQQSLPVGIISANEIAVKLDNSTRKFDAGNRQSPLYQLLVQNRRIRAWLGMKGDGSGVNMQQAVDFNTGTRRNLVVNAGRLELPVVSAPAFARASDAYAQDGTLVNTNLPRFEPGRHGQAILLEEEATNLLTAAQSTATGGLASNNFAISTLSLVSNFGRSDLTSALSTQVAAGSNQGYYDIPMFWTPVTPGLPYTHSFYVFTPHTGKSFQSFMLFRRSDNSIVTIPGDAGVNVPANTWTRITQTATAPAGAHHVVVACLGNTFQIGEQAWFDDIQLEQRAYATTWQIGGTPRTAETLTIPTAGVLSPTEGTIEFWARPNHASSVAASDGVGFHHLSWHTAGSTQGIVIRRVVGGITLVSLRAAGNLTTTHDLTWVAGQDIHIAARWTATDVSLFVNGALRGTIAKFDDPGSIPLEFGWRTGHTASNALHDDLRISNRARSDAEIAAAFASGQPLPVDANTTYLLRMDGNLNHGQGGDYTSPEYDLSTVGTAITSGITWQAPADGVARDVSARLDGQAWTPVTNGGPLPFAPGQLLTGRRLQVNALLRRG